MTVEELDLEIHFVKKSVVVSQDSRSSEEFMNASEKRKLLNCVCSNSTCKDQTLTATFRQPFDLLAITNTTWQRKKAAGDDSSGLRKVVAPHTGQSSQLSLNANDGGAQFLSPVARNALVRQAIHVP